MSVSQRFDFVSVPNGISAQSDIAKLRMVLRVNSPSKSEFCSRNRKRPNEQEKEKWHSTYMGFDVPTESPTDENLG
jgi:hypothetical protein